ncbi:MAG: hypothetical protein Unbinned4466contig1000_12 [Prokaryotic dsDNA virus sp.]|nr:MAG: hypothetical protein Unbinned4466contig1000_12 [Prokaryotic dsDNA virus sp.]|tara:strand:- start:1197 stop:1607 length:411 start_codon:yes stop_codon:yes gene_type:complete
MSNIVYIGPAESHPDVTEFPASEVISPRQVLVVSSGAFAVAGADQEGMVYFALENILGEVTEDYQVDETVQGARPQSGEYYEMALAAGQTIAKDDALTTDASGNLVALGAGENVIAYADEAVTTTGSAGSIRVYVK